MDLKTDPNSQTGRPAEVGAPADRGPILIVSYLWIGDFVRCHTVVRVLNARFPGRPVDMLSSARTLPLVDYMPGVRKGILTELPRGQLAIARQRELAARLRREGYGTVLVMPGTWKSALAPFLAGIPQRIGFVGEARFGLLNDLRWGERKLARMIDRKVALALPKDAPLPPEYPEPQLRVPDHEIAAWRSAQAPGGPAIALCPATVGPGRSWPVARYAELAQALTASGHRVWVLGSPDDRPLAMKIALGGGSGVHDLTGPDLRQAVLALAAADAVVANDSGLLHVAAALGAPAVGLFGPTRPFFTGPLNPLAAAIEANVATCSTCGRPGCTRLEHRRIDDVPLEPVLAAVREVLGRPRAGA